MSSEIIPRRHRHTRSAAIPSATASSQNPQNPHHLNAQVHANNNPTEVNMANINLVAHPATPPRTPRRNNHTAPQNRTNSGAPETGSKQKSRNKNRPNNVVTSPAATRNQRKTPPMAGPMSAGLPSTKPINTPSAYAGATFHASPAPSALPIPSFYSKSVPDSPAPRGLRALKDNPSSSQMSTPPPVENFTKRSQREESPLDMLFNADRADKARARSAISYQAAANGPFQPPTVTPRTSQTPPATRSQTRSQTIQSKRISGSGMFAMEELDGEEDSETPLGPAFSTPYSERINAARSGNQSSQLPTPSSAAYPKSQDSAAVRAFLFSDLTPSGANTSNGLSYQPQPNSHGVPKSAGPTLRSHNHSFSPDPRLANTLRPSTRSSGLRQEVTPSKTPTRTPDRNSSIGQHNGQPQISRNSSGVNDYDLLFGTLQSTPTPEAPHSGEVRGDVHQQAEDALRKILKLDALSISSNSDPRIGNIPQATVSVPNYVGSRPPPMNGLHNGVMGS